MNTDNTNDKEKESADNASSISSDLIRGHINTIILRTLYDGDKYGYEIINEIEEKSKGQYSLKQPTLYSALKRLESQDYVTSYWGGASNGGRRKYFQITDKGKAVVEQNRAEWEYSRTVIDSLISERDYDFSNPPPASSVDFNILKKSTSRVPISYSDENDEIELPDGRNFREIGKDEDYEDLSASENGPSEISDELSAQEENVSNLSATDTEIADDQKTDGTAYSSQAQSVQEQSDQTVTYAQSSINQTQEENFSSYAQNTATTEDHTSMQNAAQSADDSSSVSQTVVPDDREEESQKAPEPQPLTDDEKNRIHENYKALIGEETDATSYYYAQVARDKAQEPKQEEPVQDFAADPYANGAQPYPQDGYTDPYAQQGQYPDPYAQGQYADPYAQQNYSDPYSENRAISSELLYSNKSPAERNYKKLLNKLYDNTHKQQEEDDEYAAADYPQDPSEPVTQVQEAPQPEAPAQQQTYAAQPSYTEQPRAAVQPEAAAAPHAGNTASNIEFYDVEEKAQNEGLRITTTNGSRNRTMAKAVGNTFDKGRALLLTAIYVFIVALAECIINHCLHNVLSSGVAYIVIPYVLAFVMLGVFLFLFLNGYGKNSRKTQSKSYLSASLVIFINIVLIIVLIAYLVIYFGSADLSTGIQILKYAIFPIIYAFNLPLFALLYRVNSNKQ